MKVALVLYCSETAEFACKEIERPPVLQERMLIGFSSLMLQVEKIVWAETMGKILLCCGIILKINDGPQEGSRVHFPFGKIPEVLWPINKKNTDWSIQVADTKWDAILAPVFTIIEIDGEEQSFTGEY